MSLFGRASWGPVEVKGRAGEISARVPGSSWVTVNNRMRPKRALGQLYMIEDLKEGVPILVDGEQRALAKQRSGRDRELFLRGGRIWFEGSDPAFTPDGLVFKGQWNGEPSLRIGSKRLVRPFRVLGFLNTTYLRFTPFRPKVAAGTSPDHVALYFACWLYLREEV